MEWRSYKSCDPCKNLGCTWTSDILFPCRQDDDYDGEVFKNCSEAIENGVSFGQHEVDTQGSLPEVATIIRSIGISPNDGFRHLEDPLINLMLILVAGIVGVFLRCAVRKVWMHFKHWWEGYDYNNSSINAPFDMEMGMADEVPPSLNIDAKFHNVFTRNSVYLSSAQLVPS